MKNQMKSGIVEKVEFTQGGAGNQWTTIDGVRYATYWDCRTTRVVVGETVKYRPFEMSLWSGQPKVPHAAILPNK